MKTLLACFLLTATTLSQDFSLSSGLHFTPNGSLLGVAGSANLMTWNNRKVIVRAGGAYYSGSSFSRNEVLGTRDRVEVSIESKNTMQTGRSYFNILQAGYHHTLSRTQETRVIRRRSDSGFFFSGGFGTRISPPVSIMVRYVTGFESGFRFGLDYDF